MQTVSTQAVSENSEKNSNTKLSLLAFNNNKLPMLVKLCTHQSGLNEKLVRCSPLTGLPGGLGLGEVLCVSPSRPSKMGRPNMASSSFASGGGMGKRPIDSSTRDNPILHTSDCTEQWVPCNLSGYTANISNTQQSKQSTSDQKI